MDKDVKDFLTGLIERNPHEVEFHQAVEEVIQDIYPIYLDHKAYVQDQILDRLTEPDRIISFRVSWEGDDGKIYSNKAWRVQFNNSLGPYKGGLRFHPSVNQSILKFLGFEQVFKNSLTGLPLGGGKGGSNFDPKGKSDREVMRFCHSLMIGLHRYIGKSMDVPAGDIGVGAREIGYLFGQYMRLVNQWTGVLTGKGISYGGSAIRKEATGYGAVYITEHALHKRGDGLANKKVLISGSGNVALYAAEKCIQKGAQVLTLSDSKGMILAKDGLSLEQLQDIKYLKEVARGRLVEYADKHPSIEYFASKAPWAIAADIAMPCATQNEIQAAQAKELIASGIFLIAEGANMPVTPDGIAQFRNNKLIYIPGKAANAGGVAVSGLEMSQNSLRLSWTHEEVDQKLQGIMKDIHQSCVKYGESRDYIDYAKGANVYGFFKSI
ncbi:MAG: NADP-specific glutamate dehydrogenase [Bdellovibrionota bacterium]